MPSSSSGIDRDMPGSVRPQPGAASLLLSRERLRALALPVLVQTGTGRRVWWTLDITRDSSSGAPVMDGPADAIAPGH